MTPICDRESMFSWMCIFWKDGNYWRYLFYDIFSMFYVFVNKLIQLWIFLKNKKLKWFMCFSFPAQKETITQIFVPHINFEAPQTFRLANVCLCTFLTDKKSEFNLKLFILNQNQNALQQRTITNLNVKLQTNLSINVRRYQSDLQLLTAMSPNPQTVPPIHDRRFVTYSCKIQMKRM